MAMLLESLGIAGVCLVAFYAFGLALMPQSVRAGESPLTCHLLAPALGSAVWAACTLCFGALAGYNAPFLWGMAALAAAWTLWRRARLEPPAVPAWAWLFCAFFGFQAIFQILPWEIDGGLYFGDAVYDHAKAALVDAVARDGLPPQSPFFAENGTPLAVSYYYGWHAFAAQLRLCFGVSGYLADAALTAFSAIVSFLTMAGLAHAFARTRAAILWVAFFAIFSTNSLSLLPDSLGALAEPKLFLGYWPWCNNVRWVPQHVLGAVYVLTALWLLAHLLAQTRKAAAAGALIGIVSAAAFFCSLYAGTFALLIFCLCLVPALAVRRAFRKRLWAHRGALCLCVGVGVAMSAQLFLHLLQYTPLNSPLRFALPPAYADGGWAHAAGGFLHFYGAVLPTRLGIAYPLWLAVCFWNPFKADNTRCLRRFFIALSLATTGAVFFVQSTFATNDFGWRVITAGQQIMIVFAAVLACRAWALARATNTRRAVRLLAGGALAALCAGALALVPAIRADSFTLQRTDPAIHRAFAAAKEGWRDVRALTAPDALVLSNPDGFAPINMVAGVHTNLFCLLYADRGSPVSDLVYPYCLCAYYDMENVRAAYARAVGIFEKGAPAAEDAAYLADTLCAQALLVTPRDGLWANTGALSRRYACAKDTPHYRVYLKKAP